MTKILGSLAFDILIKFVSNHLQTSSRTQYQAKYLVNQKATLVLLMTEQNTLILSRFTTPHHKEGFELFLDTITVMEDVWLVTSWQAIQWMRDPTPLSNINSFPPFQCSYNHRPPRCTSPKVMIFCNSTSNSLVILVKPKS